MSESTSSLPPSKESSILPGDKVQVAGHVFYGLTFVIDEITEEFGEQMACGPYGCFAIDLLEKTA